MRSLFDETHIGSMRLKNRFFRSATNDKLADASGHMTKGLCEVYTTLARGGVGSIITGLAAVSDMEALIPNQMAIYDDSFIEDYAPMVQQVHECNTNIILQIAATGSQTTKDESKPMWGPSEVMDIAFQTTPQALSEDGVHAFQKTFADAAHRAKQAGFDGVQIHSAHGYFLSRFLTPYYNRRTDQYGGSLENRCRMLMETYAAVRAKVGPDYPVLVKINCDDFMEDGFTFDECLYVCTQLDKAGIDAIEISGGSRSSRENEGFTRKGKSGGQSYFAHYAKEIKRRIQAPVISVGGHREFQKLTNLLQDADYLALSRPFICEADLIARWESGDTTPSKCISCSKCHKPGPNRCVLNTPEENE